MSTIGYSYGSGWQLLRFLGYHRDDLDRCVEEAVRVPGAKVVRWLPFLYEDDRARIDRRPFDVVVDPRTGRETKPPRVLDVEYQGIRFLDPTEEVRAAWAAYWPQSGRQQNWDYLIYIII
jgi:hypothetical protein